MKNLLLSLLLLSLATIYACNSGTSDNGDETDTLEQIADTLENNEQTSNEWQPLFNGNDLTGWIQRNGEAKYTIENGTTIVGTAIPNTPNSFLCTEKMYDDFILELEVMVDTALNSGIQIRSNSTPDYTDGRVHGYQIEIDPSPRAYSGGLYDEARRGWLQNLDDNEAGRKAFKNGEWNKYKIETDGATIKAWVNGVETTNYTDTTPTLSGFIALQVHSIDRELEKKPYLDGTQVKWRNIRIKEK